jgi:hypothetical protein
LAWQLRAENCPVTTARLDRATSNRAIRMRDISCFPENPACGRKTEDSLLFYAPSNDASSSAEPRKKLEFDMLERHKVIYRRNRSECIRGQAEIVASLTCDWTRELRHLLIKELWTFAVNLVAVPTRTDTQ